MMEATWKDDEITGYGKMVYTKQDIPKVLDPMENTTTVLSYSGYLKECRMDGEGTLVTYSTFYLESMGMYILEILQKISRRELASRHMRLILHL